jgi:hypothetical protein
MGQKKILIVDVIRSVADQHGQDRAVVGLP